MPGVSMQPGPGQVVGFGQETYGCDSNKRTWLLWPNADVSGKDQWTENPVGSMFDRLDDVTREDWIETATIDAIARWDYTTVRLDPGETVVAVELDIDMLCFGGSIEARLMVGGDTILTRTYTTGTDGHQFLTTIAPLTQNQVDNLRGQVTHKVGGTSICYSAPLRLYTRMDVWANANQKVLANRDPTSGLSVAAGYYGGDVMALADLGGGRSFGVFGDTIWATAAGQKAPFVINDYNNNAAPNALFIRNSVMTMDSYDVDAATFAFYSGAGPATYFPDITWQGETSVARWPIKTFVFNSRLWVVGHLAGPGIKIRGTWAAYTDSFAGAPSGWTWTYTPPLPHLQRLAGTPDIGFWDGGDGFVYFWTVGKVYPTTVPFSIYRITATAFHSGDWKFGEWWTGTGWQRDHRGVMFPRPPRIVDRRAARGNSFNFTLTPPAEGSSIANVVRRGDQKFQLTGIFDGAWDYVDGTGYVARDVPPFHISYAKTPGMTIGKFDPLVEEFEIPYGEDWVYQAQWIPHLMWQGMQPDEQVWSYATNNHTGHSWGTYGFPRFVKARRVA